jgi:hypothetical protein
MFMKIKIIACLLVASLVSSCSKEIAKLYKSEGKITGVDLALCPCCGGWYITIGADTYRFDDVPANSGIDLTKETFPLKVKLDWEPIESNCQRITISSIIKN